MEPQPKKLCESGERSIRQKGQVTELLHTLKALINNPEYSDVVFVCKNGKRVHSCRMFLIARSRFFKTMLKTGWAESKEAEISLPEISSRALLSIMNFLYTGVLFDDDKQPSWTHAFKVLGAAQFLLLEKAEEIVWGCLEDMTRKIAELPEEEDLILAARRLSVAVTYRSVWNGNDSIPQTLCKLLSSRPLEPLHLVCLSREALLYFMDRNAETEIQAKSVSFQEYVKLRDVVLWCICQVAPEEAREVSISHLPGPYWALKLLEEPSSMQGHRPPANASDYVKSLILRFGSSENLLSMIDIRRVYPELLLTVVEPLDIFPLSKMIEAYRLHSVGRTKREVTFPESNKLWKHGLNCHTRGDGFSIRKEVGSFEDEFARFNIPLCRSYGIYEWDLYFPMDPRNYSSFPLIGLIHEKDLWEGKYNFREHGWAFEMRGNGQCFVNRRDDNFPAWRKYGNKVSDAISYGHTVRVHLNMYERSCMFTYEGQTFEDGLPIPAFKNMPRGVYFPALCIRGIYPIQIKLVRGFGIP